MNEVKFTEKDFKELRKFQNKMNVVFGENAYVGLNYATVVLEYSPTLMAMIRPMPTDLRYDYEVKMLYCKKCKCSQLFLATPEENEYVCGDCLNKAKK